ncbi:HNH endonuclease [uncultured Sphingomonas sp.]|uniref:HNH endonuclease n=1 Tax=uncultured Sphingomonas sp. TaxID=158754 RepID=UPI0025CD75C4|nr:HNH endonuclease [uncultured Sphingomonas sp.]
MNAPAKLSKIEKLRLRDGDRCWLCNGKLSFGAARTSKKAPTIEHLVAQVNGGTDALDNLVLAHPGCNRQLGCRPVADKQAMRERRRAMREQLQSAARVRSETPVEEGGNKGARPRTAPQAQAPGGGTTVLVGLRRWRLAALVASGAALLATGLAAGLVIAR